MLNFKLFNPNPSLDKARGFEEVEKMKMISVIALAFAGFGTLSGEVKDSGEYFFKLSYSADVPVKTDRVFMRFADIHRWWDPAHTYTGDADKYRFDLKKMALVEQLNGGFVRHMEILYWDGQKRAVLSGGLGPLQTQSVNAVMEWTFSEADNSSSRILMNYRVYGSLEGEVSKWAEIVDSVLAHQFDRLVKHVKQN